MNRMTILLVIGAIAAGGLTVALDPMDLRATGEKQGPDPWAGLTEEEKAGRVAEAYTRNTEFFERFLKSGADPRTLPVIEVEDFGHPALDTLEAAVGEADLVVHGRVDAVEYRPTETQIPLSLATVTIVATLHDPNGLAAEGKLTVSQLGGPALAEGTEGALVHVESQRPLFAGDEALFLLLDRGDGTFRPVPNAGVFVIEGGLVAAQETALFASSVAGLDVERFSALISETAAAP